MEQNTSASPLLFGCVADDFTGAGDAASFLAGQGLRTLLFNGVPASDALPEDCSAIVIATKTRSVSPQQAVEEAEQAFRWLLARGAKQVYYKYCSTFDSTPRGNIGPVVDRMLELTGEKYTLLCPSLPVNGRTVENGVLYVKGVPLGESPMKDHPLNPMWDSRLAKLMEPQGRYDCLVLDRWQLALPKAELLALVDDFGREREHFYIVPDYASDADGARIVELFGGCRLLSGGSGLMAPLAASLIKRYSLPQGGTPAAGTRGKALLLAGSCSVATRGQIGHYRQAGYAQPVDAASLLSGRESAESLWALGKDGGPAPLFYSSGSVDPSLRSYATEEERAAAASVLEHTMARLARLARSEGVTRFIVAGGETSGAVALELGFDGYLISESAAPGVPVMIPLHDRDVRVVYKSGNFGDEDFFTHALALTEEKA